jgi:hypothetical protein
MYERSGMFCFTVGLVLTAFGVGGVEQSLDSEGLLAGAMVSSLGLMIMACGVMMLKEVDSLA